MKKVLLALSLAFAASVAQADIVSGSLTLVGGTPTPVTGLFNPAPALATPSTVYKGTLQSNVAGIFTATFLGKEAGNVNFYLGNGMMNTSTPGSTNALNVGAGTVNFGFKDSTLNGTLMNGGTATFASIGFWQDASLPQYDFLIGFNDFFKGDVDYDDYIVGVKFTPNKVPVPAALPLMASALGLFGFSRRNRV